MPEISLQNIQTFHSAILVKSLAAKGLEHVVISPGSRSTPLTLAFASHPTIQSHIVIDERSAAFIALGIASATGKPAALVCTSGTAVANYFPAVAEAQRSGLPMLVLSADRDFNEMNTGANQWIDQQNVFGNKSVFFAQVKPRPNDDRDIARLEYLAHQAWTEAISKGGCAHLNLPFRKPLEPSDAFLESLKEFYSTHRFERFNLVNAEVRWSPWNQLEPILSTSIRPVVIASGGIRNQASVDSIKKMSDAGIPVIAEPGAHGSKLPSIRTFIDGANTFLRHNDHCEELTPDLIFRFGDEPVGKGILNYLKVHQEVHTVRFSERLFWTNSSFAPETIIRIPENAQLDHSSSIEVMIDSSWKQSWDHHQRTVMSRLTQVLKNINVLRDGDVYSVLSEELHDDEILFVSNSFPARDVDSFGDIHLKSRKIFMNRGASGIDGIISTALGVALSTNSRVTLIIGDLAFAHDLSALIPLKNLRETQLRIVVINNNGGGIFEMLPISGSQHFDRYFRTSQSIDACALAKAAGLPATKVNTAEELKAALKHQTELQVIECITDQKESMLQRKILWG